MSYLTLTEAADYATKNKGFTVEPGDLLRSGVQGWLVIRGAFPAAVYRNANQEVERLWPGCFLVIPPASLLEIESEGKAKVRVAFTTEKETVFPYIERGLEHLRIAVHDLAAFLPLLVSTDEAPPISLRELVSRHERMWPTISSDAKAASKNGLRTAAGAGSRAWHEHRALQWAKQNNRLREETPADSLTNAWAWGSR